MYITPSIKYLVCYWGDIWAECAFFLSIYQILPEFLSRNRSIARNPEFLYTTLTNMWIFYNTHKAKCRICHVIHEGGWQGNWRRVSNNKSSISLRIHCDRHKFVSSSTTRSCVIWFRAGACRRRKKRNRHKISIAHRSNGGSPLSRATCVYVLYILYIYWSPKSEV